MFLKKWTSVSLWFPWKWKPLYFLFIIQKEYEFNSSSYWVRRQSFRVCPRGSVLQEKKNHMTKCNLRDWPHWSFALGNNNILEIICSQGTYKGAKFASSLSPSPSKTALQNTVFKLNGNKRLNLERKIRGFFKLKGCRHTVISFINLLMISHEEITHILLCNSCNSQF